MEKYDCRIATFAKWPLKRLQKFTKKVARSGYYHTPTTNSPDSSTCYLCGSTRHGWTGKEDPHKAHIEASIKERDGEPCALAAVLACADDAVGDPSGEEEVEMRVATFADRWPYENDAAWEGLSGQRMASAGFIYWPSEDSNDNVSCPYCEIELDGWEATDDPRSEHIRRTPKCPVFIGYSKKKGKANITSSTTSKSRRNAPPKEEVEPEITQKGNSQTNDDGENVLDALKNEEKRHKPHEDDIIESAPKRAKVALNKPAAKKTTQKTGQRTQKKPTKRKVVESDAENDNALTIEDAAAAQPSPKKLKQTHTALPSVTESLQPISARSKSPTKETSSDPPPLPIAQSQSDPEPTNARRPRRQKAVVSYAEDDVDLDGKPIVKKRGRKEKEVEKEAGKEEGQGLQKGEDKDVGASSELEVNTRKGKREDIQSTDGQVNRTKKGETRQDLGDEKDVDANVVVADAEVEPEPEAGPSQQHEPEQLTSRDENDVRKVEDAKVSTEADGLELEKEKEKGKKRVAKGKKAAAGDAAKKGGRKRKGAGPEGGDANEGNVGKPSHEVSAVEAVRENDVAIGVRAASDVSQSGESNVALADSQQSGVPAATRSPQRSQETTPVALIEGESDSPVKDPMEVDAPPINQEEKATALPDGEDKAAEVQQKPAAKPRGKKAAAAAPKETTRPKRQAKGKDVDGKGTTTRSRKGVMVEKEEDVKAVDEDDGTKEGPSNTVPTPDLPISRETSVAPSIVESELDPVAETAPPSPGPPSQQQQQEPAFPPPRIPTEILGLPNSLSLPDLIPARLVSAVQSGEALSGEEGEMTLGEWMERKVGEMVGVFRGERERMWGVVEGEFGRVREWIEGIEEV
ncbi:hypothetical protein HDV00_005951 [Rhizophlyctis rosea]|nr:hypothetical protein HDV00_005951 [Rhizophlyctis rosea]